MDSPSAGFRPEGRDLPAYDHPIPEFEKYHREFGLAEGQERADSMMHIFQMNMQKALVSATKNVQTLSSMTTLSLTKTISVSMTSSLRMSRNIFM